MYKISREVVIDTIVQYRMQFISEEVIRNNLEYETGDVRKDLFNAVSDELSGCSNGFLSEFYYSLIGMKVEVIGKVEELLTCPCCGFKTLSELYDVNIGTGYDICRYCQWEDDGTSDPEINSSVNNGSMIEYRKRIEKNKNFYYKNKWLTETTKS